MCIFCEVTQAVYMAPPGYYKYEDGRWIYTGPKKRYGEKPEEEQQGSDNENEIAVAI